MKRQNKHSKKLNLDRQAVRELKLVEIEGAEDITGSNYRLLLKVPDSDC